MSKMIGKRVYLDERGHLRLGDGDYGKDESGVWCARPPGHHMGNFQNHKVTEHEDGTITVSPSILLTDENGEWHGFLENGIWRTLPN